MSFTSIVILYTLLPRSTRQKVTLSGKHAGMQVLTPELKSFRHFLIVIADLCLSLPLITASLNIALTCKAESSYTSPTSRAII
jgi:ABC-type Fe3+ transport system permease subunit